MMSKLLAGTFPHEGFVKFPKKYCGSPLVSPFPITSEICVRGPAPCAACTAAIPELINCPNAAHDACCCAVVPV